MPAQRYTTNQAADVFRQFSDGDPGYTLYYPDGSPADALNTLSNATPETAFNYYADHPDAAEVWNRTVQQQNAAWQRQHPADAPQPSWLDQIEAEFEHLLPTLPTIPWGWVGLGVAVIVVAPMILGEVTRPARRRRARR
jgi:hypothetical protein